jgi:hypothetical protein
MLRTPVTLAALALSVIGIVGQVMLHVDPGEDLGFGMVWVAVGNCAIGLLVGLRTIAYLFFSGAAQKPPRDDSWGSFLAPAGVALAVQAASGVLLGIYSVIRGSDTLIAGSVLAVLVAVGAILTGLLIVVMLILPFVLIGFYVLGVVQYRRLRKAMGSNGSAAEAPFGIGALVGALLLFVFGIAAFCVAALQGAPSVSGVGRPLVTMGAVLFDFSSAGPVDQPLAWGARVCAIGIVAVFGLLVAAGMRLAAAVRESKEDSLPPEPERAPS